MVITSAEEFIRLRTSSITAEYNRAAWESAPVEVWWAVIRLDASMKKWVIHNKTVPIEVLRLLATDADDRIRWNVATKRKLDADLFEQLSRDVDCSVRRQIALNRKVPFEILRQLASDSDALVRDAAQQRLSERS
jgi:hypothetical protein